MVRRCGPAGSVLAPRLAPGSRFRELSARPGGYPSWLKGALSRVNRQIWPTSPRSPVRIGSPRLWIRSFLPTPPHGGVVWFTGGPFCPSRRGGQKARRIRAVWRLGPRAAALSVRGRFRRSKSGHHASRDRCVKHLSRSRVLWWTGSAGKQNGPAARREFRRWLPRRLGVFSRCSEVPQQPASRWKTDPSPRSPGPSGTRVSVVPACLDKSGNALQSLGQI